MTIHGRTLGLAICITAMILTISPDTFALPENITDLTQHFNEGDADVSPWVFVPAGNVCEIDTQSFPGVAVIGQQGNGQDIKGILPQPIRFDDYPMPWYFQLGMIQPQDALGGHANSDKQINYAFGLNLAVTFSDPSDWPEDRTQRPSDTHDVQLLLVHLGASGEVTAGLPQYTTDIHPERFLVWGRGDLGYSVMGDWRMTYLQVGNGMKYQGSATSQVYFQCVVEGPTRIGIGVKFDPVVDYRMRWIDFAELYGKATGIWEIGPIISCDRWIPDVLCRSLAVERPDSILLGTTREGGESHSKWVAIPQPLPEPPLPNLKHLVNFCVFNSFASSEFEHFSSDFDIPGYLGMGRYQLYGSRVDTTSHPGYLTITKMGQSIECFAWGTPGEMSLADFPAPWEIEMSFIPPDDAFNWDIDLGFGLKDPADNMIGYWYPGVYNDPRTGRKGYFDYMASPAFPIEFDPEPPQSTFNSRPLRMLIQFIDDRRVRVAFRGEDDDCWHFSRISGLPDGIGPVASMHFIAWNASAKRWPEDQLVSYPIYQQYLIDYIHYRYGLTEN